LAELIESGTGIAILGPAGVGKSRLLHELVGRAERSGVAVVATVASQSTRTIPFAPFVELLPGGPTTDRLAMLGAARTSLEARAGGRGLLLAVDDAHQLDESSLAFLMSAVNSGVATVAFTARTGEPMESDLVDLWTNGVISRIDVGPLGRDEARLLLEATLGPVSTEVDAELWRLAEGNPLILHELIEGARGTSMEKGDKDVWELTGSIAESPRLSDLVASRLGSLPEELRPTMDMVAVGAPLPWRLAVAAVGEYLPALEDKGLVAASGTSGDRKLVAAHPLYGEILEAHIGEARTRAAYRKLVEAATKVDSIADPLQVALWQRDSGEVVSPELAIAGARAALVRHEPGLTEELLRALGTSDDRVALLLGRALSYRQRFAEAEELLAGREPSDPEVLGEIASIRAQNMGFGLGRVVEARTLLHQVAGRIEDPELRARLINERAMVSAIHGDFVDSMLASNQVLSDPDTSVVSRAAAYVTLTVALAMTGDCDRMDEVLVDALDVTTRARDVLPFARDQVGVMQMSSALHAGRIPDALRLCSEAIDERDRGNAMATTWLTASVMAQELSGQLIEARTAAHAALRIFAEADPFGLEAQARGVVGLASGQMGIAVPEDTFELDHPQAGPRLTVWIDRGRAWSLAARDDIESAIGVLVKGGRAAAEGEHDAWAALCFSDVVRFGRPDLVLSDLRRIDTSRGAHLLDAIKQQAEAAAGENAEQLRAVSERFASFGCWLLAAEAYAQASVRYKAENDDANAARSAALSMAAEARCQDPRTPALAARPSLVTPRELVVSLDAAAGLTSPQISEKRFISARTVDNPSQFRLQEDGSFRPRGARGDIHNRWSRCPVKRRVRDTWWRCP
jgi:DNA-binding NarL/FixJ family response regulator